MRGGIGREVERATGKKNGKTGKSGGFERWEAREARRGQGYPTSLKTVFQVEYLGSEG